jgi:hypothetical protein
LIPTKAENLYILYEQEGLKLPSGLKGIYVSNSATGCVDAVYFNGIPPFNEIYESDIIFRFKRTVTNGYMISDPEETDEYSNYISLINVPPQYLEIAANYKINKNYVVSGKWVKL